MRQLHFRWTVTIKSFQMILFLFLGDANLLYFYEVSVTFYYQGTSAFSIWVQLCVCLIICKCVKFVGFDGTDTSTVYFCSILFFVSVHLIHWLHLKKSTTLFGQKLLANLQFLICSPMIFFNCIVIRLVDMIS